MISEKYPYQKEWEDYRKKSSQAHWAWFINAPIFALTILFIKNFSENYIWVPFVIFFTIFIVVSWFTIKVTNWACPRCGETFRNKMLFVQMLAADCRKCGLIKYEGSTFKTF